MASKAEIARQRAEYRRIGEKMLGAGVDDPRLKNLDKYIDERVGLDGAPLGGEYVAFEKALDDGDGDEAVTAIVKEWLDDFDGYSKDDK